MRWAACRREMPWPIQCGSRRCVLWKRRWTRPASSIRRKTTLCCWEPEPAQAWKGARYPRLCGRQTAAEPFFCGIHPHLNAERWQKSPFGIGALGMWNCWLLRRKRKTDPSSDSDQRFQLLLEPFLCKGIDPCRGAGFRVSYTGHTGQGRSAGERRRAGGRLPTAGAAGRICAGKRSGSGCVFSSERTAAFSVAAVGWTRISGCFPGRSRFLFGS